MPTSTHQHRRHGITAARVSHTGTDRTRFRLTDPQEHYNKAAEEQQDIIRKFGNELSFETLSEMEVLHRNITEALRMHPPLLLVMRYAKKPFSVTTSTGKSYVIPKVRLLGCGTKRRLLRRMWRRCHGWGVQTPVCELARRWSRGPAAWERGAGLRQVRLPADRVLICVTLLTL